VEFRCDCLTVLLRYRQVRQEIWLQFTFGPSDRLRFTMPGP